jgi:cellulose synthase/poly-beta-1,6-N-acetylglucosamine synthase-like glycosyltransferase
VNLQFHTIWDWIFLAFGIAVLIQLIYFWLVFGRFAFYKPPKREKITLPVSVVICAKNEYHHLKKHLPVILNQDYPEFEVVVVNDASDDETIFLLEDLDREYEHMKVVTIEKDLNFFKGKKFPLALGIKSARYENLLLTDADCEPASDQWIAEMASGFNENREVVLGYGPYFDSPGFLNKIIRYETAFTAIQYFSLALWGKPYMGVGRNLAYKKSLFMQHKGFISHYKVSSGDDDLFINKVARKSNTSIILSPRSFARSRAKEHFKDWWWQKRRHLSTGKYYKAVHKLILGGYSLSYLFVVLSLILFLITGKFILLAIILFLTRLLSQIILFKFAFNKLEEKKLLLISPLIELIITLIYPLMVGFNLVSKESRWK